jgi:hypothetical protein
VDYYRRDAHGDREVGKLGPEDGLAIECGSYRAALSLDDISMKSCRPPKPTLNTTSRPSACPAAAGRGQA